MKIVLFLFFMLYFFAVLAFATSKYELTESGIGDIITKLEETKEIIQKCQDKKLNKTLLQNDIEEIIKNLKSLQEDSKK